MPVSPPTVRGSTIRSTWTPPGGAGLGGRGRRRWDRRWARGRGRRGRAVGVGRCAGVERGGPAVLESPGVAADGACWAAWPAPWAARTGRRRTGRPRWCRSRPRRAGRRRAAATRTSCGPLGRGADDQPGRGPVDGPAPGGQAARPAGGGQQLAGLHRVRSGRGGGRRGGRVAGLRRGQPERVGGQRARGDRGPDRLPVDDGGDALPGPLVGERTGVGAQPELGDRRLRGRLQVRRRGSSPPSAVRTAASASGSATSTSPLASPAAIAAGSSRRSTSWSSTDGVSQYRSLRASTTSPRARSTDTIRNGPPDAGSPLIVAPVQEPGASLSRCAGSRSVNSRGQAG